MIRNKNLLTITESQKEIFNCKPIKSFKRNKNHNDLIGSNKTGKAKVKKRKMQKQKPDKCSPYVTNIMSLCCKQVRKTTTFKIQQIKKNV